MATTVRPEVSRSNRYFISKHRYYELKHFCLQYHEWHGDPNGHRALIRSVCEQTDPELSKYIFEAVTKGYSYSYIKTKMGIPCGRSLYFDRYRKFFWLLNDAR